MTEHNQNPMTKKFNTYNWCFSLGLIMGSSIFLMIWGYAPLNPLYIDWILYPYGSDFSFTGIATLQFLRSEWGFPLGVTNGLLYPSSTSVVFFDSIPLVAIFAKMIHFFYPHDFQYFGIWGLFCMAMQGGIAALIIRKYSSNLIITTLSAAFFCTAPFLLGKMFGHPSMSGQFVILLPMLCIWYRDSDFVKKNHLYIWPILCSVSVGILIYFTPMVFLLMLLYYLVCAQDSGFYASLKGLIISTFLSLLSCVLIMWVIGGFLPNHESSNLDYGLGPFNLNGLFNPSWVSKILQPLSTGPDSGGEGYAWLGLGVVIGFICLVSHAMFFSKISILPYIIRRLPYIFACVILVAFAASNKVMFGDRVIISYILPDELLSIFSIFRTSGRFIWPVWYLVVIFVIGNLAAISTDAWRKAAFIMGLLLIQIVDGSSYLARLNHVNPPTVSPPLTSTFWKDLRLMKVEHVVFVPFSGKVSHSNWGYIASEALRQGITTNTYWLGRYPMKQIQENINSKLADLKNGQISDKDLIIINYPPLLSSIDFSSGINSYLVDGQVVLGNGEFNLINSAAKKVSVKRSTLPDYLRHLQELDSNLIIIFSARQDKLPVKLDDSSASELAKLNIAKSLNNSSDMNFLAVLGPKNEVLFESQSNSPVAFESTVVTKIETEKSNTNIRASVDLNFGRFPNVIVDGIDCSHSYVGLNICVYDPIRKKVLEIATFDLFAMTMGVHVESQ